MLRKALKWFLFILVASLVLFSIFVLATPREFIDVAEIDAPIGLEIEMGGIELKPVSSKKINVNYEDENGVISNIGNKELPLSQSLCRIESAQKKELRQGGRELLFITKTKTEPPLVMVAIIFSFLGLVVFSGFLKPWS